jgi:hypothetical protein
VGAFGIGLTWFGYALTSWGYCMVRGYPVKFTDWINPLHPYAGAWPPPGTIPADEVFPSVSVGSAGDTEAADPSGTQQVVPAKPGAKSPAPAPVPSGAGPVVDT